MFVVESLFRVHVELVHETITADNSSVMNENTIVARSWSCTRACLTCVFYNVSEGYFKTAVLLLRLSFAYHSKHQAGPLITYLRVFSGDRASFDLLW